jgi:hypothetical protein
MTLVRKARAIVCVLPLCACCPRRRVLLRKLSLMMRRGPRMSQQVRGWCRTSGHSATVHAVLVYVRSNGLTLYEQQ